MWGLVFTLDEVYKDVLALAVGNDDADACLLHLLCRGVFGVHTAATEGALLFLDIY